MDALTFQANTPQTIFWSFHPVITILSNIDPVISLYRGDNYTLPDNISARGILPWLGRIMERPFALSGLPGYDRSIQVLITGQDSALPHRDLDSKTELIKQRRHLKIAGEN